MARPPSYGQNKGNPYHQPQNVQGGQYPSQYPGYGPGPQQGVPYTIYSPGHQQNVYYGPTPQQGAPYNQYGQGPHPGVQYVYVQEPQNVVTHNPYGQMSPRGPRHGANYQRGKGRSWDHSRGNIAGPSFSDTQIRNKFICKVYSILFVQLLVTCAMIAVFIFVEPVKHWVQHDGRWFYILAYVAFFILYIALVCCSGVRRKYPTNYICLALFTLALSYLAAAISSYHNTHVVLISAGVTALLCLAITIFAMVTKIDFTLCTGLLLVAALVPMLFLLVIMIFYFVWGPSKILIMVYAGLITLAFGLFLIYDTQQVIGGKSVELSPEDYIAGSIQLYVDIVNIFLAILCLFQGADV